MSIRIGVIGCGAISQRRHIPEVVANADCTLAALCDINRQRLDKLAADHKDVPTFTDYRVMLKGAELDAVVVATPNALHASQAIEALDAGKHVLVEKPMATTLDEARAMMKAAEANGKFLMIGLNQRLMPQHAKAKEILDGGKLGRVLTFQTTFKHPGPDGWSVDGAKSWFFRKPEAVMGVTGDLGVHKADLMRFLLGQEFTHVGGFITTLDKRTPDGKLLEIDDNAFLPLKTAGGVIGSMTISWTNYGGFEDNGTSIHCEKGVIKIGEDPRFGVAVFYRTGQREWHELGAVATNTRQVASGIMDRFAHSIKTNTAPAINGHEGYKSLEVILSAIKAAESGRMLPIGG